ncbi:HDOD domain-containing protein [uncultured Nitrospira sp.]|uniref:HDOD domain-containing protein n=1 Tax=uncultured Nitrospira sp. TaxID=157176 RepID=UPI0031404F66
MKPATAIGHTTQASFLESLLADAPETLPILRQSCIQVLNLTQDKRSSASDIGEIIMRDQAMMANVIKIANSPAYHTRTPVKTPTYAVALIGFDVTRAMVVSAQLIEQADTFGANTVNLKHLLARALVAGTQAQELGKTINYGEAGSLFTNAMLYSLGDLILALCRPDVGEQLEVIRREDPAKVAKAELSLLGRPLHVIAAAMAKHWNLPDSLVQLLEKKPVWPKSRPEADQRIMESIVRAANELSYCLLNPLAAGQGEVLQGLIEQFLPPFGLSMIQLEHTVSQAFRQASEIASAINIDRQHFLPASEADGTILHNHHLHRLTQTIHQALHQEGILPAETAKPDQQASPSLPPSPASDRPLLDFTIQAMKISEPSSLLTFATRTLYVSYGFERVWLALVVPGKDKLQAKIGYGPHAETIQDAFHCPLSHGNFWDRLLHSFHPIQYSSLGQEGESGGMPTDFLKYWGDQPGFAGTLYAPNRPIGVILVDRGSTGHPLTDTDFAAFALVLSQTNANLARLATKH